MIVKVSILSMQRVVNYGSFLQAYALKKTIETNNANVSFLDILPGKKLEAIEKANRKRRYKDLLKRDIRQILGQHNQKIKFAAIYQEFAKQYLGLTEEKRYDLKSDIAVIGSDEVFNCTTPSPWGFSTQLFGEHLFANKIITYAASCGATTLTDIKQYHLENELSRALNNVSNISVRDENSYDVVKNLTSKKITRVLDPTFLYDYEKEINKIKVNEKDYIILYAYPARFLDKKEVQAVKEFAKKKNKKIIAIGFYQYWCDKNLILTPFEYLAYIKKADYIITDTFHGTVFSVKYNKNFCSFVRDSNKNKLDDLLEKFELKSRKVKDINEMEEILEKPIDYKKVNDIIQVEKCKSLEYLNGCLQGG